MKSYPSVWRSITKHQGEHPVNIKICKQAFLQRRYCSWLSNSKGSAQSCIESLQNLSLHDVVFLQSSSVVVNINDNFIFVVYAQTKENHYNAIEIMKFNDCLIETVHLTSKRTF